MLYNFDSSIYAVTFRSLCQTDAGWTSWNIIYNCFIKLYFVAE